MLASADRGRRGRTSCQFLLRIFGRLWPRCGDGFFDEGLFDAGAHVAGDELDEVFGFSGVARRRRSTSRRRFGGGAAGFGEGGECRLDISQGEGRGGGGVAWFCGVPEEVGAAAAPKSPWRR